MSGAPDRSREFWSSEALLFEVSCLRQYFFLVISRQWPLAVAGVPGSSVASGARCACLRPFGDCSRHGYLYR